MVRGEPSHMLVPGYGTQTVNILRLWRARAGPESFDLGLFNAGRYAEAVEAQMRSENLTKVLYPSDSTEAGRELRLKQQYFLVCCSLRDIIRRFRFRNSDWEAFPDKVVIQLNDTHPVLAIPELMRLLVDENGIGWEQAWSITRRTFAYTCHTLLPEALETWPVPMFGRLLPRHLEIIHALNRSFLADVRATHPGDDERIARMSLIQEGPEQRVRMANLAVVGSFAVNGVAGLQSRLLAATTLRDFADLWPEKFLNVTNGVSPRRFLRLANPRLSALITARLGDQRWLTDLDRLAELEAFADDAEFRAQWREAKRQNKLDLAAHALAATGVTIDPGSLFDVMVKRLHEYKRQILKLLHVVTLYNRIKADPAAAVTPCTVIFGAKAAPGYQQAKRIIKLINSVAAVVNADPDVAGRIKVVFLPDYNVSVAEVVVAAGNLSEQISLAGKEASGTGNMKLALNGALTVGTLDGANIEIRDRVGPATSSCSASPPTRPSPSGKAGTPPAPPAKATPSSRPPSTPSPQAPSPAGTATPFEPVLSSILDWDEYLVLADYRSYIDCHDRAVGPAWADQDRWDRMSILNAARVGFLLLRPHRPRLQPRHLARRARACTSSCDARPSRSPAWIDVAQVFDNLAGRLNDSADRSGQRKAGLDRDPLTCGRIPAEPKLDDRRATLADKPAGGQRDGPSRQVPAPPGRRHTEGQPDRARSTGSEPDQADGPWALGDRHDESGPVIAAFTSPPGEPVGDHPKAALSGRTGNKRRQPCAAQTAVLPGGVVGQGIDILDRRDAQRQNAIGQDALRRRQQRHGIIMRARPGPAGHSSSPRASPPPAAASVIP